MGFLRIVSSWLLVALIAIAGAPLTLGDHDCSDGCKDGCTCGLQLAEDELPSCCRSKAPAGPIFSDPSCACGHGSHDVRVVHDGLTRFLPIARAPWSAMPALAGSYVAAPEVVPASQRPAPEPPPPRASSQSS